jgi:hypothetical protein
MIPQDNVPLRHYFPAQGIGTLVMDCARLI